MPVALLGLLAVSVLVTGILVNSSTEAVLSFAYRDAAEDLYVAEGAIHAWIGERGPALVDEIVAAWTPPAGEVPVRIEVERLTRILPGDHDIGVNALFSIHATPVRSGGARGAVALVRTRRTHLPDLATVISAPLVTGGGGRLVGSYPDENLVRDGSDTPFCPSAGGQADDPVLHAADTELELLAGAAVEGTPKESALDAKTLLQWTLPGVTMRDLAWNADIKFGRYFNEPGLEAGSLPASGHADARYDWGCPRDLVDFIRDAAPGPGAALPCSADADSSRYLLVAIDAGNDEFVLSGHHGQGMLVVVNGSLHLTGSFIFKGLILSEGDVVLSGAGNNWPPSIEGGIVAGGAVVIDRSRTPPELGSGGSRSVRFNRCAIERVREVFNAANDGNWGAPRVLGRPHAWFEVLR